MDNIERNKELNEELLDFIKASPCAFHAVKSVSDALEREGFEYLRESGKWKIVPGGKYYTTRNGSSIIAFTAGNIADGYSFRIAAAHTDSPCYKIKAECEKNGPGEYIRLNTEGYGAMIDSTWLDRPLGIAGRVYVRDGSSIKRRLYCRDNVLLIPNLPIHFNRDVNSGYSFNRQTDLCPMFSAGEMTAGGFYEMLAEDLETTADNIVSADLFVVNSDRGRVWGRAGEFISAPRLDDLQCVFAAMKGFLNGAGDHSVNVLCCFDNEEVGSNTRQGAMSTFLKECLSRINAALGKTEEDLYRALSSSFMLSADNAHAVHPNHPEKTDAENRCFLNRGIVIKENASQKYTTDAVARAVVTEICKKAGAPYQLFANRSDMAGGSTLGNLSNIQASMPAADIGLPQLAMHSCCETAGAKDTESAVKVFEKYYSANVIISETEMITVE